MAWLGNPTSAVAGELGKVAEGVEPQTPAVAHRTTRPRHVRPAPVAEDREFAMGEMFFSTTDRKGIIRSGNRVFVRVSGYAREELVGSPHNIIRHPEMPRVVFKLLWEEIEEGRPFAGYVKNMASDGRYYWVMAAILPFAGGYLSVRIKPSTSLFATAQSLYGDLLALEREVEGGDPRRRKEAMATSRARLEECLRKADFPSYQAFMRAALLAEVRSREAALGGAARRHTATAPPGTEGALGRVLGACTALGSFLDGLMANLDQYGRINEQLGEKARFMRDMADEVGLFALNALIAAARLGEGSAGLSAVAELLQAQSRRSMPMFQALSDDVDAAATLLASLFYPIAATKLQAEMLTIFARELLEDAGGERATEGDLSELAGCLADQVEQLVDGIAQLTAHMRTLNDRVRQLKAGLKTMRALELQGRVEAARDEQAEAVVGLFHSMTAQIEAAHREMDQLEHLSRFSFSEDMTRAQRTLAHVESIRQAVGMR